MNDLGRIDRLAAGAIGEPGDRTFFLEVGASGSTRWFVLEKEQVAALAREALSTLRRDGIEPDQADPAEALPPEDVAFRIGEMRVGYRDGVFHFVLLPVEEGDSGGGDDGVEFEADGLVVAAMAVPALEVVSAGRPLCPRCGLPEDPAGHVCPASNGDLRRSRR